MSPLSIDRQVVKLNGAPSTIEPELSQSNMQQSDRILLLTDVNNRLKAKIVQLVKALEAAKARIGNAAVQPAGAQSEALSRRSEPSQRGRPPCQCDELRARNQWLERELEVSRGLVEQRESTIRDLNARLAVMVSPKSNKHIPAHLNHLKYEDIYTEEDVAQLKNKCLHLLNQNAELRKEKEQLNKLEKGHLRAIGQLVDEQDSPRQKEHSMINDLRVQKNANYQLREQLRELDRQSKQKHEHMVHLEEKVRELRFKLERRQGGPGEGASKGALAPLERVKAQEKIDELQRAAASLAQTRERDQRIMKARAKQYEKNLDEAQK